MKEDARRIASNGALLAGSIGFVFVLLIGVFGPQWAPQDPNAQHSSFALPVLGGLVFPPSGPDPQHPLGTDPLGRDQLSRLLVGARTTLVVVLVAAMIRMSIGVAVGVLTGWAGGVGAAVAKLFTATITAIPQLLLAVLLVLVLRPWGVVGFIAALAAAGWPAVTEFVQSEVVRTKAAPFIEGARSVGASDARLLSRHVVIALTPQLLSLVAVETGAVLLLLAELGLVGLFLAGATYYLNENGLPVLPLRDRAPEWGQMLGGIQFYAIQDQIVVLIPAAVILLFAVTFTLLADGLRIAADPFGSRGLRPRTFQVIAQALAGALCLSAVGFAVADIRPAPLTLPEGRPLAAEMAERTWPGSVFVAAAVRYSSSAHAMERPQRLTYYFGNVQGEVLRISFENADRLAMEVRPYESEDGIDFPSIRAIPMQTVGYERALKTVDASGGARWRLSVSSYLVRITLTWPRNRNGPVYSIAYGTESGQQAFQTCCYDATNSEFIPATTPIEPFLVPSECQTTKLQASLYFDPRGLGLSTPGADMSAWYRVPAGHEDDVMLGSLTSIFYAKNNEIVATGSTTPPELVSATSDANASVSARFGRIETLGAGAYSGVLDFDAIGCWHLRMSAGGVSFEFTVWVYPSECRYADPSKGLPADCHP